MPEFGEIIKFLLDKKDMTQADLARRMNTKPQNVTSILSQKRPRIDTVQKVADALGVSPSELTGDIEIENHSLTKLDTPMNPLEKIELQTDLIQSLKGQVELLKKQNQQLEKDLEDCRTSNTNLKNS